RLSQLSLGGTKIRPRGPFVMEPSMSLRGRVSKLLGYLAGGPALAARGRTQVYRHSVAALIGLNCRHLPTCSTYADEAVARFGLWAGGWMTLARLCRCHPFGTSGLDFVPASVPDRARWYLPWRYGRWRGTNCRHRGHALAYFQKCGGRNQDKLESLAHTRNQQDQALAFGLRYYLEQRVRFD